MMDSSSVSLLGNKLSERKSEIDYKEVICEICNSIMIFPVTLPCGHELCLDCYNKSKDLSNLCCPYCRYRISCWARKATKDNKVVNWKKWELIKTNFPHLVQIKVESNQSNEDLEYDLIYYCKPISRVISSDGEIRKEYEEFAQKEKERQLVEENENKLLIEKLLAEDQQILLETKRKLVEETVNDEEIARSLQQHHSQSTRTLRNRSYLIN